MQSNSALFKWSVNSHAVKLSLIEMFRQQPCSQIEPYWNVPSTAMQSNSALLKCSVNSLAVKFSLTEMFRQQPCSQIQQQHNNDIKERSPCNSATKAQRGIGAWLYSSFNLGARCGWVFNATPRPLHPQGWPSTLCTGGCEDTMDGLHSCGKSRLLRNSIPGPSRQQRFAIPTELSRPTYKYY